MLGEGGGKVKTLARCWWKYKVKAAIVEHSMIGVSSKNN